MEPLKPIKWESLKPIKWEPLKPIKLEPIVIPEELKFKHRDEAQ